MPKYYVYYTVTGDMCIEAKDAQEARTKFRELYYDKPNYDLDGDLELEVEKADVC